MFDLAGIARCQNALLAGLETPWSYTQINNALFAQPGMPLTDWDTSIGFNNYYAQGYTVVSLGNGVFVHDQAAHAYVIAPNVGASIATSPFTQDGRRGVFAMYTGKTVFLFGGSAGGTLQGSGVIGVPSTSPTAWHQIPTGSPPMGPLAVATRASSTTQSYWTGAEAIVFVGAGTNNRRYQPPVGCVCPSTDDAWLPESACAGVTGSIPACVP